MIDLGNTVDGIIEKVYEYPLAIILTILISWIIAEALCLLLGTTIRALANRFIFKNED